MNKVGANGARQLGNTNPTAKSNRVSQSKYWCFTFNNFTESDRTDIINHFDKIGARYIIGIERGENNLVLHLQGYVEVDKKMRWSEFKLSNKIHWEPRKGSQEDNLKYCSKDGNFVIKGMKIKKPLKVLRDDQLYGWQKEIIEIVKQDPDDRIIYWIWDRKGLSGKTTFCKYLSIKYDAINLEGKKNDILYCAALFETDLYVWDLERSMEDYISYAALEKIKNGYFMCQKYESKPIHRNSPHIIVFANFAPEISKLSLDRWMIYNLDKWREGDKLANYCTFNGNDYKEAKLETDILFHDKRREMCISFEDY